MGDKKVQNMKCLVSILHNNILTDKVECMEPLEVLLGVISAFKLLLFLCMTYSFTTTDLFCFFFMTPLGLHGK